ncbi:hypothetical protein [Streptomyces sp. HUAS TT3]|uniref:hypothetical protein n=1 Tax=Streptomyces sp. HUAS TT3 TaxID=3447510 RepID=UPI003F657C73
MADALCQYGAERDRLLRIAAGCGGTDVDFTPAPSPEPSAVGQAAREGRLRPC